MKKLCLLLLVMLLIFASACMVKKEAEDLPTEVLPAEKEAAASEAPDFAKVFEDWAWKQNAYASGQLEAQWEELLLSERAELFAEYLTHAIELAEENTVYLEANRIYKTKQTKTDGTWTLTDEVEDERLRELIFALPELSQTEDAILISKDPSDDQRSYYYPDDDGAIVFIDTEVLFDAEMPWLADVVVVYHPNGYAQPFFEHGFKKIGENWLLYVEPYLFGYQFGDEVRE